VTSLKHFPYVANSDFHKLETPVFHGTTRVPMREELARRSSAALAANVDIALTSLPQRLLGACRLAPEWIDYD
jgi:hypothetical protein